jgi:ribokinase
MINRVIVIGSINYDHFLSVPVLPVKGQTLHADSLTVSCGGKGANQAVQCAKLGLSVNMIGAVGSDTIADKLLANLQKYDIDTHFVKVVDGASGQGYVVSAKDGSVFSTIVKGANWQVSKSDVDRCVPYMNENSIIVLQMEIPADVVMYAIDTAHEHQSAIVFNAAPALPVSIDYFRYCTLAVFNEAEAMFYLRYAFDGVEGAKKAVRALYKNICCSCVLTIGPAGSVYCGREGLFYCPAEPVPVVETTGAGDSFIGGLVFALAARMEIPAALKFASKCSAVTIQRIGAQDSMPFLTDIE